MPVTTSCLCRTISPDATSLDKLDPGQSGRIVSVAGPTAVRRRLMEMGLGRDVTIEVLRRAPLGDPIELGVRGYLLSLRREQAALVGVVLA